MKKLTTKQVVGLIGVSRRQVLRWQVSGVLRPIPRKPGANRRGRNADTLFRAADIERLRKALAVAPFLDSRCVMGKAFPGARIDADLLARIGWSVKSRVKNSWWELIKDGRRRALSVNRKNLVIPPAEFVFDVNQTCKNKSIGVVRYLIGVVFLANTRRQDFPSSHISKAHKRVVLDLAGGELGKETPPRAAAVNQFLYAGVSGDTASAFDSVRKVASADVLDRGIEIDRFRNSDVLTFLKWQYAGRRALDYPSPNFSDIAWLFGVSREIVRRDAANFKPSLKWIKNFAALFNLVPGLLPKEWQTRLSADADVLLAPSVSDDLACLQCGALASVSGGVVRCSACDWQISVVELQELAHAKNEARTYKKTPVRGSSDG